MDMAMIDPHSESPAEARTKPKEWAIGALLGFAVYIIISGSAGLVIYNLGRLDDFAAGDTLSRILLYFVVSIPFMLSGALFMGRRKRLALISFVIFWAAIPCAFMAWLFNLIITQMITLMYGYP